MKALLLLLLGLLAAIVWYAAREPTPTAPIDYTVSVQRSGSDTRVNGDDAADGLISGNTSSTSNTGANPAPADVAADNGAVAEIVDSSDSAATDESASGNTGEVDANVDVFTLGETLWKSDEEFLQLKARLSADPALLAALFEQYPLVEGDDRRARLARLLAEFSPGDLSAYTGAMMYSGDADDQMAAIQLLKEMQVHNPQATELLTDMLGSPADGNVLRVAIAALPGPELVSDGQRQDVLTQLSPLVQHSDPKIRSQSVSVLSRWAVDDRFNASIAQGLSDTDTQVRSRTAYALVDYPHADENIKSSLLSLLENQQENRRARRGALLALSKMSLSAQEAQRVEAVRQVINRSNR